MEILVRKNESKVNLLDYEIINCIKELQMNNTNKSVYYLYFIKSIENNILDPNLLLSISINNIKKDNDCILPVLALRYGANSNIYLRSKYGNVHLIVYTLLTLRENRIEEILLDFLLYCFIIKGSNVLQYCTIQTKVEETVNTNIDNNFIAKILGESAEEIKTSKSEGDKIIKNWLYENGKAQFSEKENIKDLIFDNKEVSDIYKQKLAIICDNPEYLLNIRNIKKINISDILEIRCINILNTINYDIENEEINGEYQGIKKSIYCVWFQAFKHFLDKGLNVTYFSINRLVLKLNIAYKNNNTILISELTDMLLYAITKGCHIDTEQLNIIAISNNQLEKDVIRVYESPYWKKICGNNNKHIPDNLKRLAFNLNINYSDTKETICSNLNTLNSIPDKETLKQSAINRQQKRISDDVASISNFINGSSTLLESSNLENSFEYSDYYVSYYKDSNNNLWCFLSNMYESLLKSQINPNTNELLPDMFLDQIKYKLKVLKELNINISNPRKIDSVIDELSINDKITNTESDYIVNTIFSIAALNGINIESIKNLSYVEMNDLLKLIGVDQSDTFLITFQIDSKDSEKKITITLMTYSHLLITFCRAVYFRIKNDTNKANQFFILLKNKIKK